MAFFPISVSPHTNEALHEEVRLHWIDQKYNQSYVTKQESQLFVAAKKKLTIFIEAVVKKKKKKKGLFW